MTPCTYARHVDGVYEFGTVHLVDGGTKNEKREHRAHSTRPTMDEALKANKMALKGHPRLGQSVLSTHKRTS